MIRVQLGDSIGDVSPEQLAEWIRALRVGAETFVSGAPLTAEGEWRRLGELPFWQDALTPAPSPYLPAPPGRPLSTGTGAPPGAVELVPLPAEARRVARWDRLLSRPPLVTMALIAACTALFVATSALGGIDDLSVLGRFGAKVGPRVARGEYWRLVTANFLHGGIAHLLSNSIGFYVLGRLCENLFSRRLYFSLFVATCVTAQGASYLLTPAISVGVSGPIFGVLGATIAFHVRRRRQVPHMHRGVLAALGVWGAWSIATSALTSGIDNWAHAGGLVGGLLLGLFIPAPSVEDATPRARAGATFIAVAAGALLLACGGLAVRSAVRHPRAVATSLPEAGLDFAIPDDWSRHPLETADMLLVSDDLGAMVFVGRTDLPDGGDPRDVVRGLMDAVGRSEPAGDVAEPPAPQALGGLPASVDSHGRTWWRFQGTARGAQGIHLAQRVDVTGEGGYAYFLISVSPAPSWTHYAPTFDAIFASLTWR